MSFALLWIETLAICLLWIATMMACAARIKRGFWYWLLQIFIYLPPGLILIAATLATGYLRSRCGVEPNSFFYVLSLLIAFHVGWMAILRTASRPGVLAEPRHAAAWPRLKLALAMLTALAIGVMTLWNMDLAARALGESCRIQAGASMVAAVPPVSDDRNAAILYVQAYDRYRVDPLVVERRLPWTADSDVETPEFVEFLGRQQGTLKLIKQAAALPECRFEHDYAHPSISILLPELNYIRAEVLFLKYHARHELAEGRPSVAMADINAMLRAAKHIGREPISVSVLVSAGLEDTATTSLSEALPHVNHKEDLAGIEIGDPDTFRRVSSRAIMGEEALGLSVFSDFAGGRVEMKNLTGTTQDPDPVHQLANYEPARFIYRVFFFDSELQSYQANLERFKQFQEVRNFPTDAELGRHQLSSDSSSEKGIVMGLILPNLSRLLIQSAKAQASENSAAVAIAMTRFRIDHGSYPAKLGELVPEYLDQIPPDPFDGKPLRMVHANGQWTIYSIGPDGIDDGGKPYSNTTRTGDIAFTLLSPDKISTTQPNH